MTPETPSLDTNRSRKKARKDLIRVLAVALFFVVVALILRDPYVRDRYLDIETLRAELQGHSWSGTLKFIVAAALINAIGVPRIWVCAAAGSLFGAVEGGAVGLIATLFGASINFLMGRSLLRGPLRRHIPRKLKHWYQAFNDHGFRAILYLRLFPLTNATLTNLMGGASTMSFRDYLGATVIGYLPFTIAFSTLGSSAAKQNVWQLAGGVILIAAMALGQWLWSRRRTRRHRAAADHIVTKNSQPPLTNSLKEEADLL